MLCEKTYSTMLPNILWDILCGKTKPTTGYYNPVATLRILFNSNFQNVEVNRQLSTVLYSTQQVPLRSPPHMLVEKHAAWGNQAVTLNSVWLTTLNDLRLLRLCLRRRIRLRLRLHLRLHLRRRNRRYRCLLWPFRLHRRRWGCCRGCSDPCAHPTASECVMEGIRSIIGLVYTLVANIGWPRNIYHSTGTGMQINETGSLPAHLK